ncbi:MAG: hypothetical protein Q7J28_07020 [Caulobacter sp.]|nr:hypothetical protein [Caulobacter sp.]
MKPSTAAYVLFGLTLAWGLSSFFLLDGLSFFPDSLPLRPIVWWREFSWLTLVAFFGGLIAAIVAEPWMKRADDPSRVWRGLIAATLLLIGVGQASVMVGGVAVFPDRIIRQGPWPWSPREMLPLSEVTRIEVGCTYGRRQRVDPIYRILLADGREEHLQDGEDGPTGRERWLDAILAIDDIGRANGAVRETSTDVFGRPNESKECVRDFAASFAPGRRDEVLRLMQPALYP